MDRNQFMSRAPSFQVQKPKKAIDPTYIVFGVLITLVVGVSVVAIVISYLQNKKFATQGALLDGVQTDSMPQSALTAVYGPTYTNAPPEPSPPDVRVAAPLNEHEEVTAASLVDVYGPSFDFTANNFNADGSATNTSATPAAAQGYSYTAAYPGYATRRSNDVQEHVKPATGMPLGSTPRIEVISYDNSVDFLRPMIKKPTTN
jgi:hypothetical protein